MKKYFLLSLIIIQSFTLIRAQNITSEKDFKSAYRNFLPSNANPDDLRPSDIPSKQVLKQMGLSQEEIKEAMDFKYGKGKYDKSKNISKDTISNIDKLYLFFEDSLSFDSVEYPKARIFGQDVFRNNRLAFYQKALDAKAPENYKVGPGDEISISIWGFNDFSETLEVDSRGYISPSSYGRIYVKGLTFKDMRSILKKKFSTFFDMQNSEIDVSLSYSKVITINIVGEVYNPGSYIIPSINTAFNALIAANGPTQLGSVRNIYIKRNGKTVDSLDIYQFLFNPEKSNDIYLQDGDYLFVPPAESIVEITGAVNRPYTYEAKTGETVQDMIRYAGGYSTKAFRDIITLKRLDYNDIKVYDVHYDDMDSEIIKNGDELVINNISNKISNVITVTGDIGVSGEYEYKKGESLLQLLQRAKCISQKTFTDKVYVIRLNTDRTKTHISVNLESVLKDKNHKDNIYLKEYDIVRVLSIDDFDDEFSVSVLGAVRSGGKFDFGVGMTLQDVLLQSGGLTQQAEGSRVEVSRIMDYETSSNKLKPRRAVVKTISIGEDLVLSNEAMDFELQPFDQIFVRENPDFEDAKNVVLTGEVKYPGTYTLLSKDEKISSVIKRAGGLTNYAYLDGVKMYRRFANQITDEVELNIPDAILDSILTDVELSNIYNKELLNREILKSKSINIDSLVYDVVYFNMKEAMSNKSKHNLVLLEGDSIIIPKHLDLVHITGDLNNLNGNSISAPFFGRRASYYVNNFAGGFSKDNKKSSTIVVHANGVSKKSINLGLFSISPKVKPGSTIKVVSEHKVKRRKKEDVDYNKHIESVITKITAIMSLYLLIERVNGQF